MCDNYPWKQHEWYDKGWLAMEQTTDFIGCIFGKELNDKILDESQGTNYWSGLM